MVFVHEISCLIVVFILIVSASWNLKKGQWDGPHSIRWFLCVRRPVTQGQLSLHCAIISCFHSGELHDSDDCDQPVRVHGLWQSRCIPQVESVRQAAKIHVNRHSPICKAACLGYRELRVESRRSDAMAGRSPWQADVRHEPHPVSGISHLFAVKTN